MVRPGRPVLNIPLPPKFDANVGVEEGFLTPPIWVASNPPPMFERTEMKRTMSEASSWRDEEEKEEEEEESTTEQDNKTGVIEEIPRRPVRLHERRSQTFLNAKLGASARLPNNRRISDSVATRTRARLLVEQAFSATISSTEDESLPIPRSKETRGERKPIITASALTILTLARSSSNPYSPPIDYEKFASAALRLASPFHEKKSYFNGGSVDADEQIKKYFGVSTSSKMEDKQEVK